MVKQEGAWDLGRRLWWSPVSRCPFQCPGVEEPPFGHPCSTRTRSHAGPEGGGILGTGHTEKPAVSLGRGAVCFSCACRTHKETWPHLGP